jgi:divalent metal cation (Fe/Co/Zn/Cd) transporter
MTGTEGFCVADPHRQALWLEYFTVGYNLAEAVASIGFGYLARSTALVGFGLDSIVESLSGLVLIWRLRRHGRVSADAENVLELRAQKFVAVTFLILGASVAIGAIQAFAEQEIPEPTFAGIVIAILSLIVMPLLARRKIQVAHRIHSLALLADARETMACALLSVALLAGLAGRYFFGLWQADPIVALIIAAFLLHEGIEGWKGSGEN